MNILVSLLRRDGGKEEPGSYAGQKTLARETAAQPAMQPVTLQ
jgi:hypothetical protein